MAKKKTQQIEDASIVNEIVIPDLETTRSSDDASLLKKLEEETPEDAPAPEAPKSFDDLPEEEKARLAHIQLLRTFLYFTGRRFGRANLWAIKHYAEENNMSLLDIKLEIEDKKCRLSSNARKLVMSVDLPTLAEVLEVRSGFEIDSDSSLEVMDASLEVSEGEQAFVSDVVVNE